MESFPAEDARESLQPARDFRPVFVDLELHETLGVVAVAHLEHVECAAHLGFELDVADQDDVVEEEGEAEERPEDRAHDVGLARDQQGGPGRPDESREHAGVGREPLRLACCDHELGEAVDHDPVQPARSKPSPHGGAEDVEIQVSLRHVMDGQLPRVECGCQVPAERGCLADELRRRLLEGDEEAAVTLAKSFDEEAKRERGLA